MGERVHKIEVKIDGERFLDMVDVETMMDLESGQRNFKSMANVVKYFIWKDGAYMDETEGFELVKKWKIRQLTDTVESLQQAANDDAVNPPNGTESD